MSNVSSIRKDCAVWTLCFVAALLALHVWLSGAEYHRRLDVLERQLAQIGDWGRVPPELREMQRRVAERGEAEEPLRDWLAARTDAVSVKSETDTPLPGGWLRREAVLSAENADYGALERLLMGLSAREPRWVLESGEWTPSSTPGHGRVRLAVGTLVPPMVPSPPPGGGMSPRGDRGE